MAMNGHNEVDIEQEESLDIPDDMLKDEFCDPENPVVINFREISAAAYKIQGGIQQTPCTVSFPSTKAIYVCWFVAGLFQGLYLVPQPQIVRTWV